jgi:hypothetical protein
MESYCDSMGSGAWLEEIDYWERVLGDYLPGGHGSVVWGVVCPVKTLWILSLGVILVPHYKDIIS